MLLLIYIFIFSINTNFIFFLKDLYFQFKITDVEPKELAECEFLIDNIHTDLVQTGGSIVDKWIWYNK